MKHNLGKRALIVGGDGLIGHAICARLSGSADVWATTRRQESLSGRRIFLDLNDDLSSWQPPGPLDVAILCAASTSLEFCRTAPEESAFINVHQTLLLANRLLAQGAFVVFLSTNLVFDGVLPHRRADDQVCPRTEYGRQKALAEEYLLALGEQAAVLRFTKVLGPRTPLIRQWIDSLSRGEVIHPFVDKVMAPVFVGFAVDALAHVTTCRRSGIIQVSAREDISYADAARHMARCLGVSPNLVRPIPMGNPKNAEPAHTSLDTSGLQTFFGLMPPDPFAAIENVCQVSRSE